MPLDLKVFNDPILSAFGVPGAVVVRPTPNEAPVTTIGVWLPPQTEDVGLSNIQRREPRYVVAFPRADLPVIPRGTIVTSPNVLGGEVLRWRVDGFDRYEFDLIRVTVVPFPEDES